MQLLVSIEGNNSLSDALDLDNFVTKKIPAFSATKQVSGNCQV